MSNKVGVKHQPVDFWGIVGFASEILLTSSNETSEQV